AGGQGKLGSLRSEGLARLEPHRTLGTRGVWLAGASTFTRLGHPYATEPLKAGTMLQYFARTLGLRQLSKTQLRGVRVRPGGVDTWLRCHRRAFEWFGGLAQVPGGRWRTRRLQAPQA